MGRGGVQGKKIKVVRNPMKFLKFYIYDTNTIVNRISCSARNHTIPLSQSSRDGRVVWKEMTVIEKVLLETNAKLAITKTITMHNVFYS